MGSIRGFKSSRGRDTGFAFPMISWSQWKGNKRRRNGPFLTVPAAFINKPRIPSPWHLVCFMRDRAMAPPHGDSFTSSFAKKLPPPPRLSMESLMRTKSDMTLQFSKDAIDEDTATDYSSSLPPISEVKDAMCECCGMCEEYTAEYVDKVRARYSGRWICGLCAEAVKEVMERHGGGMSEDEALRLHMSACARFKQIRAFPALYQADAMRQILKKGTTQRAKSLSPRDKEMGGGQKKGVITRSSSCMPALTRELNELSLSNN